MTSRTVKRILALSFAFAQLALVGWLDYRTSYEVSVSILYYFPIAYAAWRLGWGWAFFFGILCTATLVWAEAATGRTYSKEWMMWEVTGMRLLGFLFVAFSFNSFKKTIDREKEKNRRLEGVLTFCNCCSRVRDEAGSWSDLSALVRASPELQARARICPDCARIAYAEDDPKAESQRKQGN